MNIAIKHREVISPYFVTCAVDELREADERHILRPARLRVQRKADLRDRLVAFSRVALFAAADEIVP